MPEAVIVAAARTPIGRAFKGSLKELRPVPAGPKRPASLNERRAGELPARRSWWGRCNRRKPGERAKTRN